MATRSPYHHGDLKAALVSSGVTAARESGESGVGLNRLATSLGVSPAAAYRHFPDGLDELLSAIGDFARHELAELIDRRVAAVPEAGLDARTVAVRRFRASGQAYVDYVVANAGLFEVACRHDRGRDRGADPFGRLRQRIDELASVGALRHGDGPRERDDAAVSAWTAVHGLALLLGDGPLARLPATRQRDAVDRTLTMVEDGLVERTP